MKGKPRFKVGDIVKFKYKEDSPIHVTGSIYIIDPYGTFEDNSDVSYDVLGTHPDFKSASNPDGECLFKHIREDYLYGIHED